MQTVTEKKELKIRKTTKKEIKIKKKKKEIKRKPKKLFFYLKLN